MRKIHTWPAALLLALSGAANAQVVTQFTYSTVCTTNPLYQGLMGDCSTLEHLYERAKQWSRTAPKPLTGSTPETPSIVLVSSETIPISAIFRFYQPPRILTSHGTYITPLPVVSYFLPASTGDLTVDTYAAAKLDRRVTSTRALKIDPVYMSPERGTAKVYNGVVAELWTKLQRQGSGTSVLWGLFGYHMPNTRYIDVIDDRSGEQHRIFNGDTITVVFADQSTIAVELKKSPTSTALIFATVAGSARDPTGKPYTLIAKPAKPGNAPIWLPSGPVTDGRQIGPGFSCTYSAAQVCTNDGGMVRCANTRAFIGPC